MKKLGDICDIIAGQSPPSESYNKNGDGLPFFQGKTDFGDFFPVVRNWCNNPNKVAVPNDILLSVRAPVGPVNIADQKCCIGRGLSAVRAKENCFYKFIFYFFKFYEPVLANQGSGSTFSAITQSVIRGIPINLPTLPEQKRFVALLDKADSLRQKRRQSLALMDEFLKSTFLKMFGDPVKNEKGWKKLPLSKIGKVITGNTPPREIEDYYGNFIEWIKTDNINTPHIYLTQASEYLSEKGLKVGRFVPKDSILVTCIAGSRHVIGNAAIADRAVSFNQQINAFIPESGNSLFFYYQFHTAKSYVQSFSTDSMKGMISKGKFETIEFINPPIKLQTQFAQIVEKTEATKEKMKAQLTEMDNNFNGLMAEVFKG